MRTSTLPSPERILTFRDLRTSWSTLVKELQLGRAFVIHHNAHPLAQLLPLMGPPLELSVPDPLTLPLIAQLSLAVGTTYLAAMAGLTESAFITLSRQRQLPDHVLKRLEALEALMDGLTGCLHATQIGPWFHFRRKELRGRTVVQQLTFPWNPGDTSIRQIQHLALDESLTRVPLTPRPATSGRGR